MENTSFATHLIALRKCLLNCLSAVVVIFAALFYFADQLFHYLAVPLLRHLPQGQTLIATAVAAPLFTPLKLTLVVSFFLAIPYVLWQLWSFLAPGLYEREKRLVWPLLTISTLLFYLGMLFAYFIVFPLVFGFFASMAPKGVTMMPDISQYLDFTLKLFFAFGAAFEVPIVTVILIWAGITTREKLAKNRAFVIVGAFVIGMLLTPPDVVSQILLAIPICLLFEVGLLLSKCYQPQARVVTE